MRSVNSGSESIDDIKLTLAKILDVVKSYPIIEDAVELEPTLFAFAFRRDLKDLVDAVNGNLFNSVNTDLVKAVSKGWLDV
jgi:hypothetical protein